MFFVLLLKGFFSSSLQKNKPIHSISPQFFPAKTCKMHQFIERRPLVARNSRAKLTTKVSTRRSTSEGGGSRKKKSRHVCSVSFNSKVEEFYTLPLEEYTDKEFYATWYCEEEYEAMMRQCLKIIKKLHQGKIIRRKYCVRGLEGMTPEAQDKRDFLRAQALIDVLEEQQRQRNMGYSDPDAIAKRYRFAAAKRCQDEATLVGQRDAKSVER